MAHRVCPWWIGYLLVSPIRRWSQNPRAILEPYLRPGGLLLLAEPTQHVSTDELEAELAAAVRVGLCPVERPTIRRSASALLAKKLP